MSDRHLISRAPAIRLRGWWYRNLMKAAEEGYFWPLVTMIVLATVVVVVVFWVPIVAFVVAVVKIICFTMLFLGVMTALLLALIES